LEAILIRVLRAQQHELYWSIDASTDFLAILSLTEEQNIQSTDSAEPNVSIGTLITKS